MIFAAVLAGGVGSRMKTKDFPKQFLDLDGEPILIRSLKKFLQCARFDAVFVGVHPDWMDYSREITEIHIPAEKRENLFLVPGGADRNSTLSLVIDSIEEHFGSREEDVIITHDSVRPFVSMRMIEENIDAVLRWGAVGTAVPSNDTIFVCPDHETIAEIPDRSVLYQAQTPQSFRIRLLKELYASLTREEKESLTDACKICVSRNYPVHLVLGDNTNLKITTPGDLEIARAFARGLRESDS